MQKTCNLVILDEVNVKLNNLDAETRRELNNDFAFFLQKARHMPAFKLGRWDGRLRFFQMNGKTYFHLLDEILPKIVEKGYDITVDDQRTNTQFQFDKVDSQSYSHIVWPESHQHEGESIELRDYQVNLINASLENYASVIEASTASGKTICCAILAAKIGYYGRSMTIVPSKNLVSQTYEDYNNIGLDVGMFYGDQKDTDNKHIVSSWQSLESAYKNRKKSDNLKKLTNDITGIIVDEVHSVRGDVLQNLLSDPLKNVPIRWGFTGTIPKQYVEKLQIICNVGPISDKKITAHELQQKGYLSDIQIDIIQTQDNIPNYDNYHDEYDWIAKDTDRIERLTKFFDNTIKNQNSLILVDLIKTGDLIKRYFKENHNKEVYFINGKMPAKKRKEIFQQLNERNDIIIVATYGTLSTGINIPRIFNLFMVEPGKSFVRVLQTIGRGLRKAKDKSFINVYDICCNGKFSKRHLTERKKYYKESKYNFKVYKV